MVFFEAPHRLAATLADMAEVFGADRPAAVCRELTKTYEEVRREPLGGAGGLGGRREVLGEMTVVVAGGPAGAARRRMDVAGSPRKSSAGWRRASAWGTPSRPSRPRPGWGRTRCTRRRCPRAIGSRFRLTPALADGGAVTVRT